MPELSKNVKLNKKLIDTLSHVEALKFKKKDFTSVVNEELREANKKVKAIAEAIKVNDETILHNAFSHEEIKQLLN